MIEIIRIDEVEEGDFLLIPWLEPGELTVLTVDEVDEDSLILFRETGLDYSPEVDYEIVRVGNVHVTEKPVVAVAGDHKLKCRYLSSLLPGLSLEAIQDFDSEQPASSQPSILGRFMALVKRDREDYGENVLLSDTARAIVVENTEDAHLASQAIKESLEELIIRKGNLWLAPKLAALIEEL